MNHLNINMCDIERLLEKSHYIKTQDYFSLARDVFGHGLHSWARIDDDTILHISDCTILSDCRILNERSGYLCFEIALEKSYSRIIDDSEMNGELGAVFINNSGSAEYVTRQDFPAKGVLIFSKQNNFISRFALDIDKFNERFRDVFVNTTGSFATVKIPLLGNIMSSVDQIITCGLREPLRQKFLTSKVNEILCHLVAYIDQHGAGPGLIASRGVKHRIVEAAAAIYANELHNPPTIENLANRLSVDKRELARGFYAVFGKTPHAFQLQRRMEHAEMLLREGGRSLSEIGRLVGYQGYRTFVRAYHSYYGRAPQTCLRVYANAQV